MTYKIGLKLWSINKNYLKEAKRLYEKGYYDFIELYVVPDSFDTYIDLWKSLESPFLIHAPHYKHLMNLSESACLKYNLNLVNEAQKFADELEAQYIIFHSGMDGDYKETARQLNIINDSRVLVENKPYEAVSGFECKYCVGAKFEEIEYLMQNTNASFCLDIGHGIAAANSFGLDYMLYLKKFNSLNPKLYHLSDTDIFSKTDYHYNIGEGNLDIQEVLKLFCKDAKITLETNKKYQNSLDDFVEDIKQVRKYENLNINK